MEHEKFLKARKIFKKMRLLFDLKQELIKDRRSSFIKDGIYMSNRSALEWATKKIDKLERKLEKL